ncbi:MAG: VanZ family protein [Candidatus Zixiibacteriota bacterium]|nr:MAG: VanZ family protein [candidate division Zixibacteria bacterium]
MTKMRNAIKYHIPAAAYAVLIIILSSLPSLNPPQVNIAGIDKVAHFLEYAILAVLVFRSFSHISPRLQIRLTFVLSLLFVFVFAALDEFYQSYIPGRQSDVYDMLFDVLGSSIILFYLWYRRRAHSNEK